MVVNEGFIYRNRVGRDANGVALADFLAGRYTHSSRRTWEGRAARGELRLNGAPARGGELLTRGDLVEWHRPPWNEEDVPTTFTVLYEDDVLLAVSKPSGLPTMHGGGFLVNTLLSFVRARYGDVSPLHRLGRATSGIVLFARTPSAAAAVTRDWREHAVRKQYRALACGVAERDAYDITARIGPVAHPRLGRVHAATPEGKDAWSTARVLERRVHATLFEVDIMTGRPHQIRIHLASIGHPLVGDALYAPGGTPAADPALPGDGGYLLHAERLAFRHPVTGARVALHAPPPPELRVTG